MANTAYLTVTPQGALMGVCGGWGCPKHRYRLSMDTALVRQVPGHPSALDFFHLTGREHWQLPDSPASSSSGFRTKCGTAGSATSRGHEVPNYSIPWSHMR